jgi:hypothetical protein
VQAHGSRFKADLPVESLCSIAAMTHSASFGRMAFPVEWPSLNRSGNIWATEKCCETAVALLVTCSTEHSRQCSPAATTRCVCGKHRALKLHVILLCREQSIMRVKVTRTLLHTRQPALAACPSFKARPRVRIHHCAATRSDGEDFLDCWSFDSLDSDDLALPGFTLPSKSKAALTLEKCYGCGAELQTGSPRTPGYITQEALEVKTRHRQRNSLLCSR